MQSHKKRNSKQRKQSLNLRKNRNVRLYIRLDILIRYILLLTIHITIIMLQGKSMQLFFIVYIYL